MALPWTNLILGVVYFPMAFKLNRWDGCKLFLLIVIVTLRHLYCNVFSFSRAFCHGVQSWSCLSFVKVDANV